MVQCKKRNIIQIYRKENFMKKFLNSILLAIVMAILVSSTVGCAFLKENGTLEDLPNSVNTSHNIVYNVGSTEREKMSKEDAIAKVSRSVVAIKMPLSDSTVGYGSGVIVNISRTDENDQNIDGENVFYIITCYHVIDGQGEITVYVPDEEGDNWGESDYNSNYAFTGRIGGNVFTGEVSLVGGDLSSDIAVLKLDITGSGVSKDKIVKADLVSPDADYKMKVGEDVFAIGNPSGTLPGTVSVGTISYINRETTISDIGDMTLLQINTDIFHGSSGGALFNMYGEVIGITNAGSDTYIGICYSIPYVIDSANGDKDNGFINMASQLLGSYTGVNYGYISGRLEKFGFTAQEVSGADGVVKVVGVIQNSQAAIQGIKENDVITMIKKNAEEGVEINSIKQLTTVITSLEKGDTLTVTVQRKKGYYEHTTVTITLTAKQFIFCDTGVYPAE